MAYIPAAPDLPRHPDLGQECTMAGCVIKGPKFEFIDPDGPGLTVDFNPGLAMTIHCYGLLWVYSGRLDGDALYRVYQRA